MLKGNQLSKEYETKSSNELLTKLSSLKDEKRKEPSILQSLYDDQIFFIKRELIKRNIEF